MHYVNFLTEAKFYDYYRARLIKIIFNPNSHLSDEFGLFLVYEYIEICEFRIINKNLNF